MNPPALRLDHSAGPARVVASGDWRLVRMDRRPLWQPQPLPQSVELDGDGIERLDPSGAWLLMRTLAAAGVAADAIVPVNFHPAARAIFELVRQNLTSSERMRPPASNWVVQIGAAAHRLVEYVGATLSLVGRVGAECVGLMRHPQQFRIKEFTAQVDAIFVQAIVLVVMMMFLLGVVFAYLLGRQALQYGANLYVVDGTTLAICRELSPILVAILIAGRSGSAITAQLGTMKFDDEIDAISVLGLSPWNVLIIPRLLALVMALPLLVFIGDLAGIGGSMLVADKQLDIAPAAFINRMVSALDTATVVVGLGKAPVFALFIGLIASQTGLRVQRNARSIGLSTTSTVVQSIVAVILLNAVIAVTLVELGI